MNLRSALRTLVPSRLRKFLRGSLRRLDARLPIHRLRCPVCGLGVRRFVSLTAFIDQLCEAGFPRGRVKRLETLNVDQYQCPHCKASDRDRLMALWLAQEVPAVARTRRIRLLDIAPSTPLSRRLSRARGIERRTADLMRNDVDDRVNIMDMRCYESCSFDGFICSHVLEHVPDDKAAMRELYRVLAPDGWGIALVPIFDDIAGVDEDPAASESERIRRFGQHDHVRAYNRSGFVDRLTEAGFRVQLFGSESFGAHRFERFAILTTSVLYIVRKPTTNPTND
ncbi:MAG: methyltransferase domain-containing protein [Planctomycetota bacterium]